MAKPKLWMGLSTASILLTTVLFAGQQVANMKAGLINDFLHLSTQKIDKVDNGEVEGSAYAEPDGSMSDEGFYKMIADSYKYCEEAVEQGSVLLKNEDNTLPLQKDERKVTLLGQASRNLFMRSGAGGAAPNDAMMVRLDQAFIDNGFEINRTVWNKYTAYSLKDICDPNTNREASINVYTQEVKDSFADYSDAAIITLMRAGTENTDPSAGKLDLHANEKALLQMVKEQKDAGVFKKVIVLLNSPMPMSMGFLEEEEYGIDAAVWMGVPGYYGAGGIVHVLMGYDKDGKVVNPSGHAPDTFAASASSSAAYQNFGNNNCVVYKEGVYVGYKYYETRYEDIILGQGNADCNKGIYESKGSNWSYADEMGYPFGFGLSYTTFKQTLKKVEYNANTDQIEATVEVENTGDMDGKASVQLYVQQPWTDYDKENKLGRPSIALMAYDKVDVEKGKKVTTTVKFDRYFLATYDYKVARTYILEGGDYLFAVGNGSHEALNNILNYKGASGMIDHNGNDFAGDKSCVQSLSIEEDRMTYSVSHYDDSVRVENQFDDADYNWMANKNSKTPITYLDREDWNGTWPTATTTPPTTNNDTNMAQYYTQSMKTKDYTSGDGTDYNVPYVDDEGNTSTIKFEEMSKVPLHGPVEDENSRFYGQEGEEVWDKFIKQMNLDDLIISISDDRGILDVAKVFKKGNSVAEGPEGLLSTYQYGDKRWATGFPTGPVYTATWDHEMQKKFGGFYGEDALYAGVASVNAPGCNINRTPYGSRASEYMSEDGILNYNVAANIVGAARKKGLIMNIKHCFLNNQETGRQGVQTWCNEQAIREIYLRPFEGALTKGNGLGIMTSYNRIGARYAATHEPLMLKVMRGEWAYKGFIIDDALTGSNDSNYSNGPAMIYCGTDLFCLDGGRGGQLKQYVTQNNDGTILECLQRANKNIMYSISRSWMGGITVSEEDLKESSNPWWKTTISAIVWTLGGISVALLGVYAFMEVKAKKEQQN